MPIGKRKDKALLLLSDGTRFEGVACGARGVTVGEVCFNTSMTGYQEILTDPSYAGQIITMTYPEMGNYGVNLADVESAKVHATGLVVRETSPVPSNWRATDTLETFLEQQGVVAISGVDTRALTRHIRSTGAKPGAIVSPWRSGEDDERATRAMAEFPALVGRDLASEVCTRATYCWSGGAPLGDDTEVRPEHPYRVVAYDFGCKESILRHLYRVGCDVTVVPANTPAAEVLARDPEGIFLSNGPGDPSAVSGGISAVRQLIGHVPMFGICLGHQIMALALGARTYKLKFGHRGGNQPVMDLRTGRVEITAQNHGFAVQADSMPDGAVVTHTNLNDGTIEGFEHTAKMLYSVQYHPEASPGPHDAHPHFEHFAALMAARRSG